MFVPLHCNRGTHWALMVIRMQEKKIELLDSKYEAKKMDGYNNHLETIMNWIICEVWFFRVY